MSVSTKLEKLHRIDDFDYILPDELIATHPTAARDGGRLLVLNPRGTNDHRRIVDLPELLPSNALVVANDTRVFKARLIGSRPTGGRVEILLVRPVSITDAGCRFEALVQANRRLRPKTRWMRTAPGCRWCLGANEERPWWT